MIKRTYRFIPGAGCEVLPDALQDFVMDDECVYEDLTPPDVSPVAFDKDTFAFRPATDLVVQGTAYTYFSGVRKTWVEVRAGGFSRSIRVYGDRKVEMGPDGAPRFTRPEPFESMPVRYDYAYGGYDTTALKRYGVPPILRDLAKARPEYELYADTPFHYARNPAGRGFLIESDAESLAAVQVPNLEFPFDPITPERLAVGEPAKWIDAPLPACMDWQSATWFPRIAHLGLAPLPDDYQGRVAEIERGWAPPDLLRCPSIFQQPDKPPRPEYLQAASPGMTLANLRPDEFVQLHNLHPEQPVCTFQLPGEVPRARLELKPGEMILLDPHLNAVVIRPDTEEVVMIWRADAPAPSDLDARNWEDMRHDVSWDTDPLGGLL